jgi:hypothetical protein
VAVTTVPLQEEEGISLFPDTSKQVLDLQSNRHQHFVMGKRRLKREADLSRPPSAEINA